MLSRYDWEVMVSKYPKIIKLKKGPENKTKENKTNIFKTPSLTCTNKTEQTLPNSVKHLQIIIYLNLDFSLSLFCCNTAFFKAKKCISIRC